MEIVNCEYGWCIISPWSGIMIQTVNRLQKDAIKDFMVIVGEDRKKWVNWRRQGFRIGHVKIEKMFIK